MDVDAEAHLELELEAHRREELEVEAEDESVDDSIIDLTTHTRSDESDDPLVETVLRACRTRESGTTTTR